MTKSNTYKDDVVVLRVRNWQVADKIADAFSKENGRISFIAYGARHMKNRYSALIQTLTHANMQFSKGQRVDILRQCDFFSPLLDSSDIEKIAYASFITELVVELTPEKEPYEEIYTLLVEALKSLNTKNNRIIALAFAIQLLDISGFSPSFTECVCCGKQITGNASISAVQGGVVCNDCKTGAEQEFMESTRDFSLILKDFDFNTDEKFSVKGRDIIIFEEFLHKFIFIQVEKPLKSLQFLSEIEH